MTFLPFWSKSGQFENGKKPKISTSTILTIFQLKKRKKRNFFDFYQKMRKRHFFSTPETRLSTNKPVLQWFVEQREFTKVKIREIKMRY